MHAGQKLRRRVNAALMRAADDTGVKLELSEVETWLLDRACELEDQREQLQARLDDVLAHGAGAETVINLSAEVRRVVATTADLLARVDFPRVDFPRVDFPRVDFHGPVPAIEEAALDPFANPQGGRQLGCARDG